MNKVQTEVTWKSRRLLKSTKAAMTKDFVLTTQKEELESISEEESALGLAVYHTLHPQAERERMGKLPENYFAHTGCLSVEGVEELPWGGYGLNFGSYLPISAEYRYGVVTAALLAPALVRDIVRLYKRRRAFSQKWEGVKDRVAGLLAQYNTEAQLAKGCPELIPYLVPPPIEDRALPAIQYKSILDLIKEVPA